jgi:hypothetical protein
MHAVRVLPDGRHQYSSQLEPPSALRSMEGGHLSPSRQKHGPTYGACAHFGTCSRSPLLLLLLLLSVSGDSTRPKTEYRIGLGSLAGSLSFASRHGDDDDEVITRMRPDWIMARLCTVRSCSPSAPTSGSPQAARGDSPCPRLAYPQTTGKRTKRRKLFFHCVFIPRPPSTARP